MKIELTALLLVFPALAGCSSLAAIDELERGQKSSSQLLKQQSMQLEVQEEYLSQLMESQQEMAAVVAEVEQTTKQLQTAMANGSADSSDSSGEAAGAASSKTKPTPARQLDLDATVDNKQVVGRNEWVWLDLLNRNLKARVDTGALSSSLNAIDLQPFERDGQQWIRFRVPDEEHPDGGSMYESPLIKHVRVRQASAGELERRPVVRLVVRLGDLIDEAEFNLTNREDMLYPLLLGRNFLRDVALVDVAQKFTQPKYVPENKQAPESEPLSENP